MRIAMIGCGWVAGRHLQQLQVLSDVEICAHVSPVHGEAEGAAHRWGGRAYSSIKNMLEKEKIDAAWITVPPGEHGEIERLMVENNIPIFVEKPLSADRSTGELIAEQIQKEGIVAAVGYHWRAMDTIPDVIATIKSKPVRMVIGAWHDSTPPPVWWRHQKTSGGQMVEQATHLFDLVRYLIGEADVVSSVGELKFRAAYPDSDVSDVSAALIRFSNGIPGVFSATCILPGQLEVYLKLICEDLLITISQKDVVFENKNEKKIKFLKEDPFLREDLAFIDAVKKNDPSLLFSSYADALKTHLLTQSVQEKTVS